MTIEWIPELTGKVYHNFTTIINYYLGKYADDITCKRQVYHNCIRCLLAQDIEWQKMGGMIL